MSLVLIQSHFCSQFFLKQTYLRSNMVLVQLDFLVARAQPLYVDFLQNLVSSFQKQTNFS